MWMSGKVVRRDAGVFGSAQSTTVEVGVMPETYRWSDDPLSEVPSLFTTLDGVRIHYKSIGDGETAVVFIHGWGCDLTAWRAQVKYLADKARLLFVDLPGHGCSDKPIRAYTMDYFAQAVEAVRRDAGVETLAMVGHSMGAPIMRQYYRAHRSRTRALVVVDGSLKQYVKPPDIDPYIAHFSGADYLENLSQAVDGCFVRDTPGEIRDAIKKAVLSTPKHVLVSALKGILDPAIWNDDPLHVPLLQISSKLPWLPADLEAYVRQLASTVECHVLDDVGHFPMLDRPGEFNELLAAFLRRQKILAP
jgi:sigma-B regulation protein RsbQ